MPFGRKAAGQPPLRPRLKPAANRMSDFSGYFSNKQSHPLVHKPLISSSTLILIEPSFQAVCQQDGQKRDIPLHLYLIHFFMHVVEMSTQQARASCLSA
jgi:hypothetical protein